VSGKTLPFTSASDHESPPLHTAPVDADGLAAQIGVARGAQRIAEGREDDGAKASYSDNDKGER
jgi:hypothetical protein